MLLPPRATLAPRTAPSWPRTNTTPCSWARPLPPAAGWATTSAAGTSTYVYDAAGNRLLRRDPGKTTLYLGSTELSLDTATDTVTGTRYYPTPGGPTIVRTSNGKLSYTAADHHNTGTTAIDATTLQVQRRATKPFGEDLGPAPAAWPGERGFVNGTKDKATGFTHLGAREYDPRTGTFLSVDPIMVLDSPQGLNAYSYAKNSPVTTSDPTGLCAEVDCGTRPSPDHENTTPGHEPGPPKVTQTASQRHGTGRGSVKPPHSGCLLSKYICGPSNGSPLPVFTSPLVNQPPTPAPPAAPAPANCRPDDGRVECMVDIGHPDEFITDPFHKMNVVNGSNALAAGYATLADSCAKRAAQYVCFGNSPAGNQPITVGDVHFYPGSKSAIADRLTEDASDRAAIEGVAGPAAAAKYGPDLERHEAIHSRQWARYPLSEIFVADYLAQSIKSKLQNGGDPAVGNRFEIEANLWWGRYKTWGKP
ncbi:RHS repeat domain-containing protein [Streptomyces nojiriensis]